VFFTKKILLYTERKQNFKNSKPQVFEKHVQNYDIQTNISDHHRNLNPKKHLVLQKENLK